MLANRRRSERRVCSRLAKIHLGAGSLPRDCTITDISDGGVKVVAESGWFAARPSGTEDIYKIYAESFRGEAALRQIQEQAQSVVSDALARRA